MIYLSLVCPGYPSKVNFTPLCYTSKKQGPLIGDFFREKYVNTLYKIESTEQIYAFLISLSIQQIITEY